jgi:phage gp37-like protein
MISAVELAIIAALKAKADDGTLGYAWRTLESYPDDFDAYLKDKGQLRPPAAWAVFLGLSDGDDSADDAGPNFEARFAVIVAAKNLRNETASRHGGVDAVAEPGSYQLAEDAIRVLSRNALGDLLVQPLEISGARLVARSAELRTQGLSLMAIECKCRIALGHLAAPGDLPDFTTFHADWDIPPIGNVNPPLPAAAPDAEDLLEIPQ